MPDSAHIVTSAMPSGLGKYRAARRGDRSCDALLRGEHHRVKDLRADRLIESKRDDRRSVVPAAGPIPVRLQQANRWRGETEHVRRREPASADGRGRVSIVTSYFVASGSRFAGVKIRTVVPDQRNVPFTAGGS